MTHAQRSDLIGVTDAAKMVGVTSNALYAHIKTGRLNSEQRNGFRMLYVAEIKEYMESRAIRGLHPPIHGIVNNGLVSVAAAMPDEIKEIAYPPSIHKPTPQPLPERKEPPTHTVVVEHENDLDTVRGFLGERITKIDERLARYSAQIAALEAISAKLIEQQDACRTTLVTLAQIEPILDDDPIADLEEQTR